MRKHCDPKSKYVPSTEARRFSAKPSMAQELAPKAISHSRDKQASPAQDLQRRSSRLGHSIANQISSVTSTESVSTTYPHLGPNQTSYVPTGQSDHALVVQASSYSHRNYGHSRIVIESTAGKITVDGQILRGHRPEVVSGSVEFKQTRVPKGAVSNSLWSFGSVDAIEITNLTADPRGARIGDILLYHLSRYAATAGVSYITAGNVTGARAPYYTPLGFVDFLNQDSWATLTTRKAHLETQMETTSDVPSDDLVEQYQDTVQKMKDNMIFITRGTLQTNTAAKWATHWQTEG